MARFYGAVGYAESVEDPPNSGIYIDKIIEFPYYGDVIRNVRHLHKTHLINDDVTVANQISIVADEYALKHFSKIKYVRWGGVLWMVPTAEVRSPRLVLTLGGVYNVPAS